MENEENILFLYYCLYGIFLKGGIQIYLGKQTADKLTRCLCTRPVSSSDAGPQPPQPAVRDLVAGEQPLHGEGARLYTSKNLGFQPWMI